MPILKTRFLPILVGFLSAISACTGRAQVPANPWRQVFLAPSFVLEEVYAGDWGDHRQAFSFTRTDTGYRVAWNIPGHGLRDDTLRAWLSVGEVLELERLFTDCSARIDSLRNTSTEHVLYGFRAGGLGHMIDDRFSLACHGAFRTWKEQLAKKKPEKKK